MAFVPGYPVVYQIPRHSKSRTIWMYLTAASGLPVAGIAHDTADVLCSYAGTQKARVAITRASVTTTGAWVSGGFVQVDGTNMPGVYRLDVPDAALALDSKEVVISIIKDAVVSGYAIIQLLEEDPANPNTTRTNS